MNSISAICLKMLNHPTRGWYACDSSTTFVPGDERFISDVGLTAAVKKSDGT